MACGSGSEVVGAFEHGWSSMPATGRAVADDETGGLAFDEPQVEIGEQVAEVLIAAAAPTSDETDERVEDHETGIDPSHGTIQAREVFREREGRIASRVRLGGLLLYEGEDFNVREVGTELLEQLDLGGGVGPG